MKNLTLLLFASACFVITMIDSVNSHASSYSDLHVYGKVMCWIIGGVFIFWFGLVIYSVLKKRK